MTSGAPCSALMVGASSTPGAPPPCVTMSSERGASDKGEPQRAANLGKKHTDEARRKMSAAAMGNQNWLGKKHTDETKRKIGAASKGRECTAETRRKLSAANKGRAVSDETRRKLSNAKKQWWAQKRAESKP